MRAFGIIVPLDSLFSFLFFVIPLNYLLVGVCVYMYLDTNICNYTKHPQLIRIYFVFVSQRLFKRRVSEEIGADLNQGYDTFIEKRGKKLVALVYFMGTIIMCKMYKFYVFS